MIGWKDLMAVGSVTFAVIGAGYQVWKKGLKPIFQFLKEFDDIKKRQSKDFNSIEDLKKRCLFQDRKSDSIIQLSSTPMFVCNEDGLCTLANKAIMDLFGASSISQMRGYGWLQFIHPKDRARAQHDWETAINSGGEDFTSSYTIVHGVTEEEIEATYHSIIGRDHENQALVAVGKVCKH